MVDSAVRPPPSRVKSFATKYTATLTQGAAEDRGSLAALDRELQQLSSTDVRQATLQVTDGQPLMHFLYLYPPVFTLTLQYPQRMSPRNPTPKYVREV